MGMGEKVACNKFLFLFRPRNKNIFYAKIFIVFSCKVKLKLRGVV